METGEKFLYPSADEQLGTPWRRLSRWHFVVVLAVTVFFGAIRWRLLDMPLERDEGEYAYAGQLILQDIPPYRLAYNMKLPGTYAAYAAILAVFGQTARGVHLGLLLVNALSVILLYMITAHLFGTLAGTIAGSSYALLSTHQVVLGLAAHATHFVVLAALLGFIPLLRAEETKRRAFFFWTGIAFGITFLMKQPGLFLGAFALFYLAVQCWPNNRHEWAPWAKNMAVFLLGGALPFALTCVALYRSGVFRNFWFWTFVYARQYAVTLAFRRSWTELAPKASILLRLMFCLGILAVAGIARSFWHPVVRRYAVFVLGLLAFSCAAVCPGLYFRPHYFILMMPVVAILIAIAVTSAMRWLTLHSTSRWVHILPVIAFVAACAFAIHGNARFYFHMTPIQASRFCYPLNPFPEAVPVAEYLRQHTAPTDAIFVFGSEPEIYFYAHRHSASGYIYTYSLMEDQAYWPAMQKQMMQEVEARRPAYVVFVDVSDSWLLRPDSPQAMALIPWINQYLSDGFEEVGMVELADMESRFFLGDEARGHRQTSPELRIFKRKG
jgi:hypothetical protein